MFASSVAEIEFICETDRFSHTCRNCALFSPFQIKSHHVLTSFVFWFVFWMLAVISVLAIFLFPKHILPLHSRIKFNQVGQAIYTFTKSRSRKQKWPTDVASLVLVACLVAESIQRWYFAFVDPLWPCVKVIETSMGAYMVSISLPSCQVWM